MLDGGKIETLSIALLTVKLEPGIMVVAYKTVLVASCMAMVMGGKTGAVVSSLAGQQLEQLTAAGTLLSLV